MDDGLATHVSKAFEQATALRNLLPEFRPNEIVIEHVHIYICTRKRIAAVFIEAENWKQLLCSSVEGRGLLDPSRSYADEWEKDTAIAERK